MIVFENKFKMNISTIYISMLTYFLHTRIDISFENIVFLEKTSNGSLKCYFIEDFENSNRFYELIGKIKSKEISICDIESSNVNIFYTKSDCKFVKSHDSSIFAVEIFQHKNQINTHLNKQTFNLEQERNFEKYFEKTVKFITENLQFNFNKFEILPKNEILELTELYNFTKKEYDVNTSVVREFHKHLNKNPSKPCVVFKGNIFSYQDIERESSNIATVLKEFSFNNTGIALFMERSQKIISSILAVLKINCFYVPIDFSTPTDRLKSILVDAKIKVLLVNNASADELLKHDCLDNTIKIINVDEIQSSDGDTLIKPISMPTDPCYMIYTSGSSGTPKGILIRNKSIANFISNNVFLKYIENISDPCIIAVNKVGFDAFVADTLLPLALGIKIVIASSEELITPKLLIKSVKDNNVNIIQTTPTRLAFSIVNYEPEALDKFKLIACGGEPFLKNFIDIIRSKTNATILNVFGPTETTVWSTCAVVSNDEKGIGRPIQNTQCFVLNNFNKFMPKYETGILFLSGDGLGEYCFDNDLQREKFIKIKDVKQTMYNTGDTAYIDCNDFVIYGNRADTQVKINGVRIELQEIESVAIESCLLKDCVVADREIGNMGRKLVLFYTSDQSVNETELRNYLRSKLPSTYVPHFFVKIKNMPWTTTNKINRKALLVPKKLLRNVEIIEEPKTKTEKYIINYLRSEYPVELGVQTKLEDIGIDSLGIFVLLMKIEEIESNFNIDKLKQTMTIKELALEIDLCNIAKMTNPPYPNVFFKKFEKVFPQKNCQKNIFLTGASGFLGIHVLNSLLTNTSVNIFCLCHQSHDLERIYKHTYKLNDYDSDRIKIMIGDISKKNFGLLETELNQLDHIDEIINCAAIVKYFGDEEKFFNTNVLSVRNLLDFSIKKRIVLNHISTLSVLGKSSFDDLSEKTFWHQQFEVLKNQYAKSKLNAEYEIYNRINEGLQFRIIRVGRLAWRYADNVFQSNPENNEFYSSLILFKEMKKVPENIRDIEVEISPIDFCAQAVEKIISQPSVNGIFHIMNEKTIKMSDVIDAMNFFGGEIEWVQEDRFVKELLGRSDQLSLHNQICITKNKKYEIESNPRISNIQTKNILDSTGFVWPTFNQNYFEKLMKSNETCVKDF